MEQKYKAIAEVLGYHLKPRYVRKYFYNVFRFLLYQDTAGLLQTLDYRGTLNENEKQQEVYLVFKFMLQLLKKKHPSQLFNLCPRSNLSGFQ
jgi:hypothetical protein